MSMNRDVLDELLSGKEDVGDIGVSAKSKLTRKQKPMPVSESASDYLSTGSTLLNLALAGRANGGVQKGCYLLLVGDSSSGKTWLAFQMLAEAANNPGFDKHLLVHDNAEHGALMDVRKYFGAKLEDRLEAPSPRGASTTVEEFYYNIGRLLEAGKPFVYVLDSMDAIVPKDDQDKFDEDRSKFDRSGQLAETGTYGTAKAKLNSVNLRLVASKLKDTGSILVILSQTREKIGQVGWGDSRTRGGGKALKFYAHLEVWTSVKDAIKKKVKGKDRVIGRNLIAKVVKCRQNGWEGQVEFPFYRGVGVDDVGCLVRYLVSEGHWKKSGGRVDATDFGVKDYEEEVIKHIDRSGGVKKLRKIARLCWHEIEAECTVDRKPRYA
jgi:RecA/RadA recombinase